MSLTKTAIEPEKLYELSWNNAQDGKIAVDAAAGSILDANPAMEALTGYSRAELIGMQVPMVHPGAERELVEAEFRQAMPRPAPHFDLHIQRKDGVCVPVAIWSSEKLKQGGRTLVIGEFRDITDQVQRGHQLSAQNWALSAYAIAALALGGGHSSEALLLQAICEAVTHDSVYVLAFVGIAEGGPGKPIRVAASGGSAGGYLDDMHLSWAEDEPEGTGPTGICIRTSELQIMQDSETAAGFLPWRERARQNGIRSIVSIPLSIKDGWRGAMVVCAAIPNAFEPVAIEVFRRLAEQIGDGVHAAEQTRLLLSEREHLAAMQAQLTEALSAMVAPMVAAMEMRDPYTAGHEYRVAEIAVAIGREMGWTEERLHGLRVAAQVHDIGKISIPAEILTKPTRLTPGEWAVIREHAETGYNILHDIPFSWPIAEIVRQHHERLDGSGYPRGLKGDAILPEARVLAVADVVEAMASHRPYRPAIKLNIALQEIQKQAGSSLDAEVVQVCVALFRDKHFVVPGWNRS